MAVPRRLFLADENMNETAQWCYLYDECRDDNALTKIEQQIIQLT